MQIEIATALQKHSRIESSLMVLEAEIKNKSLTLEGPSNHTAIDS